MKYFLTSDLHFDHANIIKYCKRPFKDVDHMNWELVRRWNERVKEEDIIFHIGDFGFDKGYKWYPKLNGQKYMIQGNHDKNNRVKAIVHSMKVSYAGELYNLVHNPSHFNPAYRINFVGHVHDKWKYKIHLDPLLLKVENYFINVGVDVWNFYPVEIQEVLAGLQKWRKANEAGQ